MKIVPLKIKDNLGRLITIRECEIEDSESLQSCVKSYLRSGFIPLTEPEFSEMAKTHTDWINKFKNGKNDLLLVAEYKGEIVGNVDLMFTEREMLKHTGYIGMGIHEDWQGQGIGTELLKILLSWVDKNADIEATWLQVFNTNQSALKLYANLGFEKTGVQRKFIKTKEGSYIDNIIMTRYTQ
ncbi:GNAT family N-acetyltransferase [Saccharicrinis aurantiacus]|uniref:GNAT family N-acetyltransferase n=1 Tax=Saccharicrinis aurantiacus TaxID=1849719 RepID=UPI0009500AB5|nr:GNAT family N-acetyltransferase [Saccharicrinis aurantiacus]